jgi:hypothetical protein
VPGAVNFSEVHPVAVLGPDGGWLVWGGPQMLETAGRGGGALHPTPVSRVGMTMTVDSARNKGRLMC